MDTKNAIRWEHQPKLRQPLMVAAFEGWNDGGHAASNALKHLIQAFEAEKFASLDPEEFYVFSESRPEVRLVDGQTRALSWQTNDFYHAQLPGTDRDVILFLGEEPNLKWRTYCDSLLSVAYRLEVSRVVTLGAYLADVLYTLPVQVNGFSSDLDLEGRYGLRRSNYEGPTGIVGVFADHCRMQNLPTLSLWAGAPYYISIPNPKAVHALLGKFREIFSVDMELGAMEKEMENFDNEINDVVAKDPSVAAYVRELKKRDFMN